MILDEKQKKIDEILTRGIGEYIDPQGIFRKKLETDPEKIVIKFGVDPTRPDIHLGHAVVLHKLRQLQNMGCKIIFLVGDITAQIGDPTGKSKVRPEIDFVEIEKNMQTYLDQVGKILLTDDKVFTWTRNSDWFLNVTDVMANDNDTVTVSVNKESITTPPLPGNHIIARAAAWLKSKIQKDNIQTVSFVNVLSTLRRISFSRLIERDMFQERIKNGEAVFMHEMLYPVLQGIDSNVIANIYGSCDLEVGGTDQHFNMLVGRDVMEMNKKIPQAVISFKLLVGLDGKEKMSKSLDNYIGITDEPGDMYGKVMSISDSLIEQYFELCTFLPLEEIKDLIYKVNNNSINPKEVKMNLSRQIVSIYHGEEKAQKAQEDWIKKFEKREIPDELEKISISEGSTLVEVLLEKGMIDSKTAWRRLVEDGAVTNLETKEKITDIDFVPQGKTLIKIGKKIFIECVID